MFDSYARSLVNDYPDFDGLTSNDIVRALSTAYLSIVRYRVNHSETNAEHLTESQAYLRRLANVLIFHVLLNENCPIEERRSAAFVAAESIALITEHISVGREIANENTNDIRFAERFTRIEAALLYLFSRYDACASGILQIPASNTEPNAKLVDQAAVSCFNRLERLCRLQLLPTNDTEFNLEHGPASDLNPLKLEEDTIARLYIELGAIVSVFRNWLAGNTDSLYSALSRLNILIEALTPQPETDEPWVAIPLGHEYSTIFHLSVLIRICIPSLGDRALLQTIPMPQEGNVEKYREYLQRRAIGTDRIAGRPVLWPSALEYVTKCLNGDKRHAVISMPTGSGKSFIGELAVSQAIENGWALYLAPTNALAEQIRGDLRAGLNTLNTEVLAFIGDQEYSIFSTDSVSLMQVNSVAVMTPEKCALALRLSPEAFENCRLVVFDECHLIGDSGSSRGPVAELVLTQLMLRTTDCRFLLMSAIVQNPEELAAWLENSLGEPASAVTIRWRPTRTLRSILGVDVTSFQENAQITTEKLKKLPEHRKKLSFTAQCALAAGLQGAWQTRDTLDYFVTNIDCDTALSVNRTKVDSVDSWTYTVNADSWVNATAISLATGFANRRIQTLVFTPASRHYPFSNGNKVQLQEDQLISTPTAPMIVRICKILAEYELGCASHVFSLFEKGVAVHTSLMLETEKIASEAMFRNRSVPIMFATGTLAQGLNLPAIAVVIAGSQIGDSRGEDIDVVQRRRFSQLLNAAGRAGRAGFANQGIVIAIPDNPVVFANFNDVITARKQVDYFQQSDDAVRIESGLTNFLDAICAETLQADSASELELEVISLLAGGDDRQLAPQLILQRTFAAYLRRLKALPDITDLNAALLGDIRNQFLSERSAPDWITIAAQRAGLGFILTLAILRAWEHIRPTFDFDSTNWSVMNWLDEFLLLVIFIPPDLYAHHLTAEQLSKISPAFKTLAKEEDPIFTERNISWNPPQYWIDAWQTVAAPLKAWMQGDSIIQIARIIKNTDDIPSERIQGKGIPQTLAVTGSTWSALSLIAGGFLAIAEQVLEAQIPISLASLPMSIKYGCDKYGTLGWFRFGVRLRRPAHLLANRFPPPQLENDEQLKEWVREKRSRWLSANPDGNEILDSIRSFIVE